MIPVSSRIENVMFDDAAVWVCGFVLAFHVRAYPCDDSCGFGIRAWGWYGDFLEGLIGCKFNTITVSSNVRYVAYLRKLRVNICQFETFFAGQSHVESNEIEYRLEKRVTERYIAMMPASIITDLSLSRERTSSSPSTTFELPYLYTNDHI